MRWQKPQVWSPWTALAVPRYADDVKTAKCDCLSKETQTSYWQLIIPQNSGRKDVHNTDSTFSGWKKELFRYFDIQVSFAYFLLWAMMYKNDWTTTEWCMYIFKYGKFVQIESLMIIIYCSFLGYSARVNDMCVTQSVNVRVIHDGWNLCQENLSPAGKTSTGGWQ